jgi:hypothetical protein
LVQVGSRFLAGGRELKVITGIDDHSRYGGTAVVSLPWLLLRVVDPANAYLGGNARRRRGPTYRGGAVFGPDVPGGSRQVTAEEIDDLRCDVSGHR